MWARYMGALVRVVVCVLVLVASSQAFASNARKFAEKVYHGKLHYGFNKEGKVVLLKGEKEAHLGAFGSGYHSLFKGSEMAQKAGSQAHTLHITAMVLSILGLASTATGATIFAVDPKGFIPDHRPGRAIFNMSLLMGGLVMLYAGMILNIRAQEKTFFAIKAYNRDFEKKALQEWKAKEQKKKRDEGKWLSKKGQILGVY